jgi:hypothetical protein
MPAGCGDLSGGPDFGPGAVAFGPHDTSPSIRRSGTVGIRILPCNLIDGISPRRTARYALFRLMGRTCSSTMRSTEMAVAARQSVGSALSDSGTPVVFGAMDGAALVGIIQDCATPSAIVNR